MYVTHYTLHTHTPHTPHPTQYFTKLPTSPVFCGVRVSSEERKSQITYYGSIINQSGEDWVDVCYTLHTTHPTLHTLHTIFYTSPHIPTSPEFCGVRVSSEERKSQITYYGSIINQSGEDWVDVRYTQYFTQLHTSPHHTLTHSLILI